VDDIVITGTPQIGGTTVPLRQITIAFPPEADVLRKSNSAMQVELEKFLSFHTYSDATTATLGQASLVNDAKIPYTFVRRTGALNGTNIIISFNEVPSVNRFVAKFNTSFTYGNGLRVNHESNPWASKDAIYGDFHKAIITSGTPTTNVAAFVHPGHQNWGITVNNINGGSFNFASTDPLQRTVLALSTDFTAASFGGTDATARTNEYKAVVEPWVSKFILEKWNGTRWEKEDSAVFAWRDNTTTPTAATFGIYVDFTPVDLMPYRIRMNGTRNIATTKDYFGIKQRIKVSGSGYFINAYYRDFVAGNGGMWYDTNPAVRLPQTGAGIILSNEVRSDGNGKNVVLRVVFNSITSEAATRWLSPMDLNSFRKNFKIVYRRGGGALSAATLTTVNDLVFIDIKGIEYGPNIATTATNINQIEITLDPSYTQTNTTKYVLLGHDFVYDAPRVTFANFDNWDFLIDGSRYWRFYGAMPGGGF